MRGSLSKFACAVLLCLGLTGCLKVPPYQKPALPAPPAFKEAPPAGWKEANPNDGALKGKWWEIFGDPQLNALEEQVDINNQNVLEAEARFREAQAAVKAARSALFPSVSAGPSVSSSQASSRASTVGGGSGVRNSFSLPVTASYTLDLWGSVRRGVTQAANTAQAQAALLQNARLLYQSELAQDYFQLHGLDADIDLLTTTVQSYQEFLTLTRNRYAGGVASDADVSQAETQLYTTQAGLTDLGIQRSQLEHAIAILIGKSPAELTVAHGPIQAGPPEIPVGVPSALLERRPDIAEAERTAAAANQQIGIAMAAFYPTLTLSASGGVQSSSFLNWLTWPSRFWTVGPQLAQTLFDGGLRASLVAEAKANYDATAASYRQTVLTAFQQVEDNLGALRIMEQESGAIDQAVSSAQRSVAVSTAQYKAGTTSYLQVITTQTAELQDQRAQIDLKTRRMTASVLLIEALGGGWDVSQLPNTRDVGAK